MDNSATNNGEETSVDDQIATVTQLKRIVATFVAERNWEQFHNPKNLAMSLSIEAAELMEHFQWRDLSESAEVVQDPDVRPKIAEEVADCLAYILALANVMQLDLSTTLKEKMARNAKKYPIEKSIGRWDRPINERE